jgi:hypothetical protein
MGRRGSELGQRGPQARKRGRGRRPGLACGLRKRGRERDGQLGLKGKGERGKGFPLFFNSFQIHFSNFQTSIKQETMHSNHDAQALIISNFIQVIFKYLEVNLFDNLIMSLRKIKSKHLLLILI